jgi:hypothetical protein
VVGLLVIGKRRFAREHLVEEEFPRLGDVLVNLEMPSRRARVRLRQKILQKCGDRAFLSGIDLPECGDDQLLVCAVGGCHDALLWGRRRFDSGGD